MSTPWVKFFFWLYLLFLVWADGTIMNPADPDLWHRLALGEALWTTGHFPPGDATSYLADYQQIADHEWGSALIFYFCYPHGYPVIYVGIKLLTLGLTLAFVVMAGLRERRPTMLLGAFYAIVLLTLLPSFQSTIRCMAFTHVFFALWLYWYQCERHGRRISTVWYVLIMLLWANLHGGYAIGLFWLFLVGAIELVCGGPWKRWAVRLGLCILVTLINPFGWELWGSTLHALTVTREGFSEWAPVKWWPNPMSYPGYKLLLLTLIPALGFYIHRRGWARADRPVVILLVVFLLISFTSARHTSLFAAVVGALIPGLFPREPRAENIANPIHRLGFMAFRSALVLIPFLSAIVAYPVDGLTLRLDPTSCPVAAVDYLKVRKIRGDLLVPFNYGSYAMWELRGRMRVSMDGRYDLAYKPATYRRVEDFYYARGDWLGLLTTPKPDAILVPMVDAIYPKLKQQPGWTEAFHDETDAVFLPAGS